MSLRTFRQKMRKKVKRKLSQDRGEMGFVSKGPKKEPQRKRPPTFF